MATAGPSQPSGSAPQWRSFSFFDLEDVQDAADEGQSPRAIREARPPIVIRPTSAQSPLPSSLILSSGSAISILDHHFHTERTFRSWDNNGRTTDLVEAGGLLVGIGEDESSRAPLLKIWDLTRDEKRKKGSGADGQEARSVPVLMRNVRLQHGQRPHPVSAIALTSNLSHLAVGLGDGTVLLYRHLLQSLTTSPTALTSLPKARVVHESVDPITGLAFREPSLDPAGINKDTPAQLSLFVATISKVLSVPVSGKGGEPHVLEEQGAGLGCVALTQDKQQLIVARDDAIQLYTPNGKGETIAYEGQKLSISVSRNNIIIVSPPFIPSAATASATVRSYMKKEPGSFSDVAKVTVFDLQNKLVGYSGTFKDGVRDVFSHFGSVFVLSSNSKLSRLNEQTTTAKLETFYRRGLYTLAIEVAETSAVSQAGLADIHRRYGDHLYGKGDFDGAMAQYVQTLGHLQPSYVIRKYLDAQRIHHLITYLQELHSRGLANPDHTTLLLNCYTKTGDKTRLDAFIKAESDAKTPTSAEDLPFDLDTAIRVCRQAGFYEHAAYLARKYRHHEDFLRIQIEDAEEYPDALRYLRSLGPQACQENMTLYGRTLLRHEPEATTELLIDLCSGNLGRKPRPHSPPPSANANPSNGSSGPAMLSYLGVDKVTGLFTGDNRITSPAPATPAIPTPAPMPLSGDRGPSEGPQANGMDDKPAYEPPSPRLYFSHFVDHPKLFIHFLEAVALLLWGQRADSDAAERTNGTRRPVLETQGSTGEDQTAVWNTLLELYLTDTASAESASSSKALGILTSGSELPVDPMHALVLCATHGFSDGLVALWESMGMYEDILRYWMDQDQAHGGNSGQPDGQRQASGKLPSDEVLRYLDMYGPENPHLYPIVLRYLTSSPDILSRHPKTLARLLETIDENRIMPALSVVQLLSRNGVASVGSVKAWLRSKVEDTQADIEADQQLNKSYRDETANKQKEIIDLANPTKPQVFQVTRCAACGGQLDLPTVHFMCKHSYHQRCLSDSEPECVLCARQHAIIREVRRNQTSLAGRHDLFVNEVREADDGFAVVAGAFGRGLLGKKVEGEA